MQEALLGKRIADILEAVAHGLGLCWQKGNYKATRQEGIRDQEVDKFSLLLGSCLQTHQGGEKLPFMILPGRHGPGLALRGKGSPFLYICDIFELIQQQIPERCRLFAINPGSGPWRHFEPLVTRTDWDRWRAAKLRNGDGQIGEFIEDFCTIVGQFSERQVIAFGRHLSARDTVKALEFLKINFAKELAALISKLSESHDIWWPHLEGCYELARVAHEKVTQDREEYGSARKAIIQATACRARDAIRECRPAAEEIWDAPEVAQMISRVTLRYDYIIAIWAAAQLWARQNGQRITGRQATDPEAVMRDAIQRLSPQLKGLRIEVPTDLMVDGRFAHCAPVLEKSKTEIV